MLDFENTDGFTVDLSTPQSIFYELDYITKNKEERDTLIATKTIYQLRDYVLEYYTMNYVNKYIFLIQPNVYFIYEGELKYE
jgi:hypothetical protein